MKKWFLIIGLGLPAALYGILMLRSSIPVTVHDEGLSLTRASIPAGSNAFDMLQTAASHLWMPYSSQTLVDLARDASWDASLATTILTSNRETLAAWDAAAQLPELQVPEIHNSTDLVPYLADWKNLALLAAVRENDRLHQGKEQDAFDLIVNDIQLSHRMENSHGPLICYLVGLGINSRALSQIQHWVGKTHLDATQLTRYIQKLQRDPADENLAFTNTIKAEYQMEAGTLEAWKEGKLRDSATGTNVAAPLSVFPVFNLSRTKALLANSSQLMIKDAPLHFNEVILPDVESNRPSGISLAWSGNAMGQIMYDMISPAMTPALAKKCQMNAQLEATRTILALRAYQLEHGKLPADLSALVPEFLEAVPIDNFDGQPLRYLPDRKMVYSVGKNLKDDGGDVGDGKPSHAPLDLVYTFDF